jgi:hypothetical protein
VNYVTPLDRSLNYFALAWVDGPPIGKLWGQNRESVMQKHKLSTFRRADFSKNIEKSASQQAINELLASNLTKAGFESDKFGALIKQSDAEARQRIANLKAEADKQSPAVLDTFNRAVENLSVRLANLKALPPPPDAPAQFVVLDTAAEIFTFPGITLDFMHVGPSPEYNSAKFLLKASAGEAGFNAFEQVSFGGFFWQNPSDRPVVVNVHGYIVLNGLCSVFSDGGPFFGSRFSHLFVDVDLQIHELWNDPATSPIGQPGQSQNALSLRCDSSGFLDTGCANGESLFRGFDLQFNQFMVPPKGIARFDIDCLFSSFMGNGETQSDFSFGGRQLLCPGVLLNVLT